MDPVALHVGPTLAEKACKLAGGVADPPPRTPAVDGTTTDLAFAGLTAGKSLALTPRILS